MKTSRFIKMEKVQGMRQRLNDGTERAVHFLVFMESTTTEEVYIFPVTGEDIHNGFINTSEPTPDHREPRHTSFVLNGEEYGVLQHEQDGEARQLLKEQEELKYRPTIAIEPLPSLSDFANAVTANMG